MTPYVGLKVQIEKKISIATLTLDGRLQGLKLDFVGFKFILSMANQGDAFIKDHPNYLNILHQPQGIDLTSRRNRVKIYWE